MLKVRVLCSVRRSNSAHSSYSLWSLGLLTLWRRPRSRWGFYHLWNSRSHPQTCRCNTIQVSLPLGDFYFENFENAKLEMKSFLGSVCVGVCGVCVRTCLCVAATHCSMSASLSTNTSMSKLSFFPSTTETHKHTNTQMLQILHCPQTLHCRTVFTDTSGRWGWTGPRGWQWQRRQRTCHWADWRSTEETNQEETLTYFNDGKMKQKLVN